MKTIIYVLFVLLIGCGGSSSPSPPSNPQPTLGLEIDKSGVWTGQLGDESAIIIIDNNNDVYGFSKLPGGRNDEYFSIHGNIEKYAEFTGLLKVSQHMEGLFNRGSYNPYGFSPTNVSYQINFIEKQTADGTVDGTAISLIYSPEHEADNGISTTGTWWGRYIYLVGTLQSGEALYSALEITISIDAAGEITGEIINNIGRNWSPPSGPTSTPVTGLIQENGITGQNIKSISLNSYNGYAYTEISGSNEYLFFNTINADTPFVARLTLLNR